MAAKIDLTGMMFNRWTVLSEAHQVRSMVYWNCICECGVEKPVFGGDLKRGMSKSCGCLMRELLAKRVETHGLVGHKAYRSWIEMKSRCYNPKKTGFKDYGGRGIKVCDEWQTFEGFWQDMGDTWQAGLSIDRIETNGNYEPSNCKWSTAKEQGNNRRTNVMVMLPDGRSMTLTQAAEEYGVPRNTVYARIRYGWPQSEWFKQAAPHAPRSPNKPKVK